MAVLLEICVDDAAGLAEAVAGGGDRVELCAALALGGLTPSPGLMALAAGCGLPVMAMIRPRAGGFVYGRDDLNGMLKDIEAVRRAGLAGVVIGASRPDGRLDRDVLGELVAAAAGLDVTLHRAIDLAPDAGEAVETAVALGIRRVLTSGGAARAVDGLARLRRMIGAAASRLAVMPGSGVTAETWPRLAGLGVTEVHASCAGPLPSGAAERALGFASGTERRTDRNLVAALKRALG